MVYHHTDYHPHGLATRRDSRIMRSQYLKLLY